MGNCLSFTLAATLGTLDVIPAAGLVLVLGVYRFISEGGALINVIGNGVATLFIAKWEGALDVEKLTTELHKGCAREVEAQP